MAVTTEITAPIPLVTWTAVVRALWAVATRVAAALASGNWLRCRAPEELQGDAAVHRRGDGGRDA
jgi:hypothetical protein